MTVERNGVGVGSVSADETQVLFALGLAVEDGGITTLAELDEILQAKDAPVNEVPAFRKMLKAERKRGVAVA